jgi:sulfatase maturation enzyme AslB (radical SAM superfamily)
LQRYAEALQARDSKLMLVGVDQRVLDQLAKTGLLQRIGEENVFLATPQVGEAMNQAAAAWPMPGLRPAAGAPPAFHLLAKPTGATCNLDCAYCFFLSKEMLYPGSRFRMADAMLETYIRQLIEAHQTPQVQVAWQGGEPTLMGLDFFQRSIELVEYYRKPGTTVEYTIQTNGTLIDDAWAAFFKQHNFLVGISIDGPQAMHDAYRVDKGGQPTFDKVMRGLHFLQKHGVEYNTLTTLHHANAGHPAEVYRFLRDDCGSRFHQFIPIIERLGRRRERKEMRETRIPPLSLLSLPPPPPPGPPGATARCTPRREST